MTARDYFKKMLADALEQNCILLEQLEQARAEIAQLTADRNGHPTESVFLEDGTRG